MREWIVTNGLGGYASMNYNFTVSRKFHGMLVASLDPPVNRWLFVTNINDKVILGDNEYNLRDCSYQYTFSWFPSFIYEFDDVKLTKTICMPYHQNSIIIKYELLSKKPCTLQHIPILNSRHFYDVNGSTLPRFEITPTAKELIIKPGNIDKILTIFCPNTLYEPIGLWNNIEYDVDHRRHDSYQDTNFVLGELTHPIKNNHEYYLQLSIEEGLINDPQLLFSEELSRKKQIVLHAQLPQSMSPLVLSADSFIVKRKTKKSIIAGYHWFSDWGRDTLIALPGITLVTKRFDDAHNILLNFSQYCLRGLIPNTFTDRESLAVYNTVDASLWYIDRIFQYLKYTNDLDTIKHLWPTLTSIIEHYKNGTDFNIHLDKDGYIAHGPGLTWMDVKHGDYYPTPRSKKAVEIQALWYNALKIMEILSDFLGKNDDYSELANQLVSNFKNTYYQIYDVVDILDKSMRPNQIFLASLDFSPVSHQTKEQIIKDVDQHLLTIFGLRTLSPDDEKYKGSYFGPYHRDFAYHNGMVWPWLLGSFISAYVKIHHRTNSARQYAYTNYLEPMMRIFGEHWDGSIPEIFDGDPPFGPRGCINQAWSVAEILRAWVEDIENIRPSFEKTILHEIRV